MGVGLGGFQEADQLSIFESITKYQAHVNNPARMAELTARAFDRALLEHGPTQLNIPRDYFYGEIDTAIPKPIRIDPPSGGEQSLRQAAELLAQAKFPVVMAGGGVVTSGAVNEARALAERLGAPVVTTYLHNDAFPCDHPLWCGALGYQGSKAGMHLISQADVVLALGTRLGPFGTLPQFGIDYWPKQAKIIQVDIDPRMLGLVKEIAVGVHGDAKAVATALLERLSGQKLAADDNKAQRQEEISAQQKRWEAELDQWTQETDAWSKEVGSEENFLHPRQVLRELEKAMPENAMVSTDIGNICSVSNSYLRFKQPKSMFAAMSFGNCGYAYPTIIGAKAAAPERPAVAYVGDGAWAMSMLETLTCVRENIPTTAVVFHNRQWGAEKKNQVDYYGRRFVGSNLNNPSFAKIAESMGAQGITVNQLGDVGDAFRKACKDQEDGKSTVLEVMCTRELGEPFRRDALKPPVRFLGKYKEFV